MSDTWDHELDSIEAQFESEGRGDFYDMEDGLVLTERGTGRTMLLRGRVSPAKKARSIVSSALATQISMFPDMAITIPFLKADEAPKPMIWNGTPVEQIEPGHAKNIIAYITRKNPVLTVWHKSMIEALAARVTGQESSTPGTKRYALLDKETGEVIEL